MEADHVLPYLHAFLYLCNRLVKILKRRNDELTRYNQQAGIERHPSNRQPHTRNEDPDGRTEPTESEVIWNERWFRWTSRASSSTPTLFLEHDVVCLLKMGEAYSATNSAKRRGLRSITTGIFISTANLASVPSVWRISIFQVSSCPKAFIPNSISFVIKANARIAERNTSKAKGCILR